ncbi:saccharopine dehydrogenase-like oxidoreductase [Harpegnathos saltator]|uniref:saccharopine dehydrogenase-like oxidoreductase n=1 Tax=Harpegnathos saltator TaxID=610380 RepID=UPI00094909DB|nr:saccharopine dehydrogenase-like oxidoreductase [Harpegnathos saltator]XP_019695991.1 saccharopine dehydrogenase-like oxidoreductase [Harpegnathos saltator]XP_019695992.1 saccharopine dehydrogenase-like oxidoreductase [Harpegnathos saltator]
MSDSRLDVVIFGATGYTGKLVVKYAVDFCKEWQLKFGIAGRRKEALENVLKEFAADAGNVPIILANVNDEKSLEKMTECAKVLINCCGPFRFYGEPVVKACITTRTHYVDITGEPQFIENMQLLYNKMAQEAGVYIVPACGWESVPSEMGIIFIQKKFGGEVNSIEIYAQAYAEAKNKSPLVNYGTWESLVYSITHWNELKNLRAKLYPDKLPEFTPKLKSKGIIHKSDVTNSWSLICPTSDRSLAIQTQRFLYNKYKQRPAQIRSYLSIDSLFVIIGLIFIGAILTIMTRMAFTRKLLLRYPTLFSCGIVGREGPTRKLLEHQRCFITFKAVGWSEKLSEPTDKHTEPPNKELIVKMNSGSAYDATCIAVILSAIMILKEADKFPNNGGVLSPGAAFRNTSLIEEMDKNNIKYKVIKSTEK